MAEDPCARCGHDDADHDAQLGYCEMPGCRCLAFISEDEAAEEAAMEIDDFDELEF